MKTEYLEIIVNYLNQTRGFDFSGYRTSMIARRVKQRVSFTRCKDFREYTHYLKKHPEELENLIDVLTINVSCFFRDTLAFEYIDKKILPTIILQKKQSHDNYLRVWSAGCSLGEEPYSVAILINELFKKKKLNLNVNIFATDIDGKALQQAQKAVYPLESIENVKYRLLKKYFVSKGQSFQLIPEIRNLVLFTFYDMFDKKNYAPPESVFGGFDIVFCRNVLIYFNTEHRNLIFNKLYRSLTMDGYLVLGETEVPPADYKSRFRRVNNCCHIYQKRSDDRMAGGSDELVSTN